MRPAQGLLGRRRPCQVTEMPAAQCEVLLVSYLCFCSASCAAAVSYEYLIFKWAESRWRRDFPHPSRPAPGDHLASCTMGTRSGLCINHPPPSSAEVKERVELYLCSSCGPSWPLLGRTLPLLYFTLPNFQSVNCNLMTMINLIYR